MTSEPAAYAPAAFAPATSAPATFSLEDVTRRYLPTSPPALDCLSIDARAGELLFLLGPSGSGKTTALRLIGGYERPDAGAVLLGGAVANQLPPHRRNVGMVFQNYALFPHLTVAQNVAFGLRMRGKDRRAQAEAVEWALALVRLTGLEGRYPRELSGGQQQRVALARAIAFKPALLLLDEPLANLDRHLRDEMRLELKALQRQLGLTTVFVTHDQEEALALADRIAVLHHGRLEALGTPAALYNRPQSAFIARFMGEMNLLPAILGESAEGGGHLRFARVAGVALTVCYPHGGHTGNEVTVGLRAERLCLERAAEDDGGGQSGWLGTVKLVTYLGANTLSVVQLEEGQVVKVLEPSDEEASPLRVDDRVLVRWTGGPPHCLGERLTALPT